MAEIVHRVGIKSASPEKTYAALTERKGLADWWTEDTAIDPDGSIRFRFGDLGGFDMTVIEQERGKRVAWRVVGGPEDWIGTTIRFDIAQDGDYTMLGFKHEGWPEGAEWRAHCSTKWAVFLMSLKSLVESGKGQPWPHDVKIDNLN